MKKNLDICINSVDALQTGDQQKNSFIGLYKEIEFEVDLESLQTIVAAAELVNCVEKRLIVQFKKQEASGTAEASEYDQDSSYLYTAGTADADDDYTLDMLDESCDDDLSSIPSIMLVDRVNRHRSSAVQEEEGKQEEHSFNSSNVLMRQGKVLRRQSELTNKQQTLGTSRKKSAWIRSIKRIRNVFSGSQKGASVAVTRRNEVAERTARDRDENSNQVVEQPQELSMTSASSSRNNNYNDNQIYDDNDNKY